MSFRCRLTSQAESAVIGCALFTAYGGVRHAAAVRPGERVAVLAAGGVGLNIVQVAKAFGAAQTIPVDVRDDKLAAARRLGATDPARDQQEQKASGRGRQHIVMCFG